MDNVLDCLQSRGLIEAITSEDMRERLRRPIKFYLGFDPTADSLHIGHLTGMMVMAWLQKYGHTPIVILGGATGRIGDPSGKSVERPLLSEEEISSNVENLRKQFACVLDFKHPTCPAKTLDNFDWLGQYPLLNFLRDVGRHFRVGAMLGKEMVRARIDSEEGISFTEFSYQLLQAYDFYYLLKHENVEMELGGSDQWGNITAGLDLIRKLEGRPAYGLTFPLLTRSDGKKFGKTEGGAIWLAADRCSPYDFYQYLYRMPDADVIKLMKMLTLMEMSEIRTIEQAMKKPDYVPNSAQKRLAEELTRMIHNEEGLQSALRATQAAAPGHAAELSPEAFQQMMKDLPHVKLTRADVVDRKFIEVAAQTGLASSKGEATRLIAQGGAYLNNERIDDPQFKLSQQHLIGGEFLLLGAGKKKKILVHIST